VEPGTAEKTRPLAAGRGKESPATAAQLAAASETVITILTDAAAIDAAYHAGDGLLSGDVSASCFVEMHGAPRDRARARRKKSGRAARR